MDEGLERCFFDCGIAPLYGGKRRALILAWLKLTDTCHIHPLFGTIFQLLCIGSYLVFVDKKCNCR